MTFEKRDWWWTIGMLVVCASIANKGGWFEPGRVLLGALFGDCLGLVISRLTRRKGAG
jgi:hypothetical protein